MSARRYVVRKLPGYRQGDKRWVVWDTDRQEWADDAHTTRRDAEDVRDELNAEGATGTGEQQTQDRTPTLPHGPDGIQRRQP